MVLSLTTWFSATAITPELTKLWALSSFTVVWLSNGVQIGFVRGVGGEPRQPAGHRAAQPADGRGVAAGGGGQRLAAAGARPAGAVAARVVTGMALAGVYPPAMKLVATWFNRDRGLALGIVIGALTLGSAMPHLFRSLTAAVDWQAVVAVSHRLGLAAAAVFGGLVREGRTPSGARSSIRARPARSCATAT